MKTGNRALAATAIAAALGMTAFPTAAPSMATRTWDGGAGNGSWSNALNWVGDVPPVNGDAVVINTDGSDPTSYDLAAGVQLASVTLEDGAAAASLTVGGSPIRLAATGFITNNRTAYTELSGGITLNGSSTITLSAGAERLVISGGISGPGPLTLIANSATGLDVVGTNSYTDATVVDGTQAVLFASGGIPAGTALTVSGKARFVGSVSLGSLAGAGIVEGDNITVTVGSDNTSTTFSGNAKNIFAGTLSLTKVGSGTLTLSGANSYTGPTAVNAGTVRAGAVNAFASNSPHSVSLGATLDLNSRSQAVSSIAGAGDVTLGSATLTTGGDNTSTTLSGVIAGTGGLTKTGTGTLTLAGNNSYTGATSVSNGTLRAGALSAFGSNSAVSVSAAGTLNLNNFNQAIGSLAGAGSLNLGSGTLTVGGNNANTTHSGTISGTGGLTKSGAGTLTLTGNNLYTGTTTFNSGAIAVGTSTALGSGGLSVQADSTLRASASVSVGNPISMGLATLTIDTQGNALTLSGFMNGIGGINKIGAGKLTITGNNTYAGGSSIAAGTIAIGSSIALGSDPVTLTGNATLEAAADGLSPSNAIALGGNVLTVDTQANTLSLFGQISGTGSVVKIGSGTVALMVDSTYSGGTTLSGGVIDLRANDALGTGTLTLTVAGTLVTGANGITVSNPIALGANALTINTQGNDVTHAGAISGTGALTKTGAGTLTLSSANSYSGATTVSAGTLRGGAVNAFGSNSAISVTAGATLSLNNFDQTIGSVAGAGSVTIGTATLTAGSNNSSTSHSGIITGNRLTKTGTGTLTLTGANTHTVTVAQNGRVNFNGNQPTSGALLQSGIAGGTGTTGGVSATGGTLAPGLSPGLLTMADMTLSSGTTYSVELNGTTAGTDYDQARVTTGAVDLSGATLAGTIGFAAPVGTVFRIIDKQSAGAVTGTFSGLAQGAFVTFGGTQFGVSYTGGNGNDVTLTVTGTPLVAPATLPPMTVGEPFSTTITASGGVAPYTFTVTAGALPAGLTLTAGSGVLSGTPTTAGPFSVTITATDSLGVTQSQAYSGTVAPAPVPSLPFLGFVMLALLLGGIGYSRLRGGIA